MIEAVRYTPAFEAAWDEFVLSSKNGAFFFQRNFQEYHADRFPDNSFLFLSDGRLIAILPASRSGSEVISHGGLTFGGVISDSKMTTPTMLTLFDVLLEALRAESTTRFVYKAVPIFYHRLPADEDSYALFRNGARIFRRDVGSILRPHDHPPFQSRRVRSLKKAAKAGLIFAESEDYASYWRILEDTLSARHGIRPVHTIDEIKMLHDRFPKNIRLFTAQRDGEILAGSVVFEHAAVVHTQYIASALAGREVGALDFVFSNLIDGVYVNKPWFSFGISTEDEGRVLNTGLIEHKEGFGARACVQDFYEIHL